MTVQISKVNFLNFSNLSYGGLLFKRPSNCHPVSLCFAHGRTANTGRGYWQIAPTGIRTPRTLHLNALPMEIEAQFFAVIRQERGIPIFLKKGTMKYEGETETFAVSAIKKSEVKSILTSLIQKKR